MANLFWKTKQGTKALLDTPFKTEEEFEKTVFTTSDLLEDIFLLKRQVRGGNKSGIPDIIGIDSDGNVCIVEMKNTVVDASIIPQVLQYAFWAETNPDSIKSLWLQCDSRPDDIAVNWDDLQVRILVIAPQIHRYTLDLVNKINYPVDLIEIKRWVDGDNHLLLVAKLEPEARVGKTKPVSGHQAWDEAFYRTEHDSASVDAFMRCVREIEKIVRDKGWNLETKFNRWYVAFKAGFFIVIGVEWLSSKRFGIFVKLPKERAQKLQPKFDSYSDRWKSAWYPVEPGGTKMSDLLDVFTAAYSERAGGA